MTAPTFRPWSVTPWFDLNGFRGRLIEVSSFSFVIGIETIIKWNHRDGQIFKSKFKVQK